MVRDQDVKRAVESCESCTYGARTIGFIGIIFKPDRVCIERSDSVGGNSFSGRHMYTAVISTIAALRNQSRTPRRKLEENDESYPENMQFAELVHRERGRHWFEGAILSPLTVSIIPNWRMSISIRSLQINSWHAHK